MVPAQRRLSDKSEVFAGVFRLMRQGAVFGVYDRMGTNDYPMAWAAQAAASYVDSVDSYTNYLQDAGFDVAGQISRTAQVLELMAVRRAQMQSGGDPLAAQMVVPDDGPESIQNLVSPP